MILLTGATGTIGAELAKILNAKGIKFRAYVRDGKKAAALKLSAMEIFSGDLDDVTSLKRAMKGITRVFLLSSADPRQAELQRNVINAAKAAGVMLIVKQSAYGADSESAVSLARWHWETEQYLMKSGVPYCILRPMMFMQNLLMDAESVKTEGVIRAPMEQAKASYIDARDIARCAATILTGYGFEGKIFDLTGPRAISYREIADEISKASGCQVSYVSVSLEDAKQAMLKLGIPEWMASDIKSLFEVFRTGRASVVTTSVRDITGQSARGIETFCKDYARVFEGELVHH